jgi:beta-lactamase regulating signal transducer with metallopeptidase domain
MSPTYGGRLILLSSATFVLVQIAAAIFVSSIAAAAIRRAGTMRPQFAARFLLALRLFPSMFAVIVVSALCVPSYLRFEPGSAREEAGVVCGALAIIGAVACGLSLIRTITALLRTSRYVRRCAGVPSTMDGETVWVVKQRAGIALAGILNPRLLISGDALRALSAEELKVALEHERAHRASFDNLKRLLVLLSPAIFPAMRLLERRWIQYAEWAADDRACGGNPVRRASLAGALVSIARLQTGVRMPVLVASLTDDGEDLSPRINRLLTPPVYHDRRRGEWIAVSLVCLILVSLAANQASLRAVHSMLERLLD